MATRSNIITLCADGKWRRIYCHWDGYPSGNGAILLEHYQDADKIEQLVRLGDLSVLAPEIGEKHDFDDETKEGWTKFYGRDRGETGVEPEVYDDRDTAVGKGFTEEYCYLWDGAGWSFSDGGPEGFRPLTEEVVRG